MANTLKTFIAMLAIVMAFSFSANAQDLTGGIEGTITDSNGAVVPGV